MYNVNSIRTKKDINNGIHGILWEKESTLCSSVKNAVSVPAV